MSRIKYYVYLAYFLVFVFVAVHFIFEAGMSYVKADGCLRSSSKFDELQAEYQALYQKSQAARGCRTLTD